MKRTSPTMLCLDLSQLTLGSSSERGIPDNAQDETHDHSKHDTEVGHKAPSLLSRVLQRGVDQERVVVTHVR